MKVPSFLIKIFNRDVVMEHKFESVASANRHEGLIVCQRTLKHKGNLVQRVHYEISESRSCCFKVINHKENLVRSSNNFEDSPDQNNILTLDSGDNNVACSVASVLDSDSICQDVARPAELLGVQVSAALVC